MAKTKKIPDQDSNATDTSNQDATDNQELAINQDASTVAPEPEFTIIHTGRHPIFIPIQKND